jgi:hypothetical protein
MIQHDPIYHYSGENFLFQKDGFGQEQAVFEL